VASECRELLEALESAMPTAAFRVLDAKGRERDDASIHFEDGRRLASSAPSEEIDPGAHEVRVRLPGGAETSARFVIREGDRDRRIDIAFAPEARPAALPAASPPLVAPADEPPSSFEMPTASWVVGGIGLGALSGFVVAAALGEYEYQQEKLTCTGKDCDAAISSIQTKFVVADVLLGVGATGLATAGIVALAAGLGPRTPGETAVTLSPTQHGAWGVWLSARLR
jgi:hypothetical protein